MSIIDELFAKLCKVMDKFSALQEKDEQEKIDFLGTAREWELDAEMNALYRVIAMTPATTDADPPVKLAALSHWCFGTVRASELTEEIPRLLAASYITDMMALAKKGEAEIVTLAA